jgi:hypothetical protein
VALDPDAEVVFLWPEVDLDPGEAEVLSLVLPQLSYFGRAESWCTARLSPGWVPLSYGRWAQSDHARGEMMAEINCVTMNGDHIADGQEPVRVLLPHPVAWEEWSYGRKAKRPDPPWNLLAETADLHAERWRDPPGSRWNTYLRPADAFAVEDRRGCIERKAQPLTVGRYALDGSVLPLFQETLTLGSWCAIPFRGPMADRTAARYRGFSVARQGMGHLCATTAMPLSSRRTRTATGALTIRPCIPGVD